MGRKLTAVEGLAVAILYHAGGETYRSLAATFGVSKGAIELRLSSRAVELSRARAKAWGQDHPERASERNRSWRKHNADRERENARKWRERNPEAFRASQRRWQAQNPDSARTRWTNRRARREAAFVEYVRAEVVWERDAGLCGICGKTADPTDWHLDHIIALARGGEHSYANVQVAHPSCNRRKWANAAPNAA